MHVGSRIRSTPLHCPDSSSAAATGGLRSTYRRRIFSGRRDGPKSVLATHHDLSLHRWRRGENGGRQVSGQQGTAKTDVGGRGGGRLVVGSIRVVRRDEHDARVAGRLSLIQMVSGMRKAHHQERQQARHGNQRSPAESCQSEGGVPCQRGCLVPGVLNNRQRSEGQPGNTSIHPQ